MYWIYLDRRTHIEDRQAELEQQTFNLFPERWDQLYRANVFGNLDLPDAESDEKPVTDVDMLDKWFEDMVANRGQQVVSGDTGPPGSGEYWSDWR